MPAFVVQSEKVEDKAYAMLNYPKYEQMRAKHSIKRDVKTIHSLLCQPDKQVGSYIKDVFEYQRMCLDSLDMA